MGMESRPDSLLAKPPTVVMTCSGTLRETEPIASVRSWEAKCRTGTWACGEVQKRILNKRRGGQAQKVLLSVRGIRATEMGALE